MDNPVYELSQQALERNVGATASLEGALDGLGLEAVEVRTILARVRGAEDDLTEAHLRETAALEGLDAGLGGLANVLIEVTGVVDDATASHSELRAELELLRGGAEAVERALREYGLEGSALTAVMEQLLAEGLVKGADALGVLRTQFELAGLAGQDLTNAMGIATGVMNATAGSARAAAGSIGDVARSARDARNALTEMEQVALGISIPGFDTGGVVPGPVGQPRLIMAHGGETVTAAKDVAGALSSAISGLVQPGRPSPGTPIHGGSPVIVPIRVREGAQHTVNLNAHYPTMEAPGTAARTVQRILMAVPG